MADLVENVLKAAAEKESKYRSIEVEKDIDLDIDEGNLLACDLNPIDLKLLRANREDYITKLSRDNTQVLFNRIWQLPTERREDTVVAVLPDPKVQIPREKPVPKARPETKWQKFSREKNILRKKKGRMVWDEVHKDWRPRWGYKKANDETKQWLIEVPDNADPNEDQFEKRKKAKSERVAKNELSRLRNIARSKMSKVPGVGLTPTEKPSKDHLSKALSAAKKSTASVGQFTENLPKERTSKHAGKKRKFEPNYGDVKKETQKQLDILNSICNKQPRLNVTQAVNAHLQQEQRSSKQSENKPKKKKSQAKQKGGKGGKKGGKHRGNKKGRK